MLKGLGQRFHRFARLPYKAARRTSLLTNASNDGFQWEKVYNVSWTLGGMEKFSPR